ncbi:hypothetical protein V5O48_014857 [Marasmius crinis-equi]|uniref:Uncharacterized protein n=1 Tax=Marasmius crinis-equi TaxID=585013 RepID=A0ABR3EW63_9AGAR
MDPEPSNSNEGFDWDDIFEDPEALHSSLYTSDTSSDDSNNDNQSSCDNETNYNNNTIPILSSRPLNTSNEAATPNEAPFRRNTKNLKEKLGGREMAGSVRRVLSVIKEEGMDLPIFLDLFSWGEKSCIQDDLIQYARTSLLSSVELLV